MATTLLIVLMIAIGSLARATTSGISTHVTFEGPTIPMHPPPSPTHVMFGNISTRGDVNAHLGYTWQYPTTPVFGIMYFTLGVITSIFITTVKCAAAAQYTGRVQAHATELAARAYGGAMLMIALAWLWLYAIPARVTSRTYSALRALLRLIEAGAPILMALLAMHSFGYLGTTNVMASPHMSHTTPARR